MQALDRILRHTPPQPGEGVAESLDGERVLGVEGRPGALALCYLAAVPSTSPLGVLPPLASVSRLDLIELGVPAPLVPATQAVQRLEDLNRLLLPPAVVGKLRFRLLQLAPHLLPAPASPDRIATSRAHLDRYLHGELDELMLHLDPAQERIVHLDGTGAIVVRGVAGSGKTAVALHRVYRLLQQRSLLGGPKLLFITFNRALASAARQLVRALGLAPDDLEITTLHTWCRTLVPGGRLIDGATRRARLRQARQEVQSEAPASSLWRQPDAFWEEEVALVKTRVAGGLEEYLGLRRHGTVHRLDARLRTLVFHVVQAYDRLCAARGELDFEEVVRRAHQRLMELGDAAPRYDHVLVDEAQDFPLLGLRLAAQLARTPGHIFVAYDPAQSLYHRGFRWKDSGILVHGARSIDLHRNFRNTREILETAYSVFPSASKASRAADDADSPLAPEPPTRHGPPVVRLSAPPGHEVATLIGDLRHRVAAGLAAGRVALLARRNRDLLLLERALAEVGLLSCRHGRDKELRLADPGVKLLTFHSAKGLEFPVVYVLADARSLQQGRASLVGAAREGDEESAMQMRRLLYVAMTRATTALVLVTTQGAAPGFLADEK